MASAKASRGRLGIARTNVQQEAGVHTLVDLSSLALVVVQVSDVPADPRARRQSRIDAGIFRCKIARSVAVPSTPYFIVL